MRGAASRSIPRFLFALPAAAVVVAVFLRGEYLLGVWCGVMYAAVALAVLRLLARSRTSAGSVSVVRVAIVLFAVGVGYALAFPASLNPGVQVFIDLQASDRRARAELATVFASDPAYRDLSVSSVHLKVVNLTVRGSVGMRADLDRLRPRIAAECPALSECFLHWDVTIRDTGQRVDGLDRDLFQDAEPVVAADGGGV